jgi:chemotaxis response regulator CheB
VRRRPVQHIVQQEGLLCGGRHALAVDRVEAAERVGDRQHASGQPRQPLEVLPGAHRETIVTNALRPTAAGKRLPNTRRQRPDPPRARMNRLLGRRVVVIGAGIGGLSAAGGTGTLIWSF